MNDSKSPLDRVVELFVYAPVGLALSARDLVPGLVERGRRQVDPQVGVARMVGQMAVSQGRSQAEKVLEQAVASAQATLEQLGVLDRSEPSPGPEASSTPATSPPPPPPPSDGPIVAPAAPPVPRTGNGPGAAGLAIPDYDSLSASQVLPRLSSLSNDELEAVRAYEHAHRGRKTILNKIAQLQGR
ncbi:MAG: hypothetical protein KY450_14845 [Actinobacteria bacterium]|nr:hypothetical protein [Actinomycetota bacterium]